ncbi:MAG: HK97 gp10 family phage protein [Treponema sp.]|nr:HK97 gp10 family phage protein [Treponema sp.]
MATTLDFTISVDNTDKILKDLEEACERALEICGGKAETYAKKNCPVDTGLLKNSITHAVGGHTTSVQTYKADRGDKTGSYSGTLGKEGDHTVYIGSNVEYAEKNELNHKTKSGFLRSAIENHREEYKNVIQSELKK